jgi:uncharacterized protein (TIGR03067 family)
MGMFDWLFGARHNLSSQDSLHLGNGAGGGELEGTWKVVSWQMGGQAVDLGSVYDKVVIQNNEYLAYRGDEVVAFFILKCDGSKHPKQVDFTHPAEKEPFFGVYAREGDTLKFCWDGNRPGKRPTLFTGAGSCMHLGLLSFETYRAEVGRLQGKWAVLQHEDSGEKVPVGTVSAIEFAGAKLILTRADQAQLVMAFSLNPLTNPKSLEIVTEPGDGRRFFMTGIYAMEGDLLRLCWNDSGHGPPAGFATNAKIPASSFLLTRAEASTK